MLAILYNGNRLSGSLKRIFPVEKVVLIFVAAVVIFFGVYLQLLLNKQLGNSENSEQPAKKESQTAVAENYSSSGAIGKAKVLSRGESFRDEAFQRFGLNLWLYQESEYLQFRERLFANSQLDLALQSAKKNAISVFLGSKFDIGIGYVDINASATDGEITEFLNKSVPVAKAKWAERESFREEAFRYGIGILGSRDMERYQQMRVRLFSNMKLASALQMARRENITVFLEDEFSVGKNYVNIDVNATDEKIIKFLLGK